MQRFKLTDTQKWLLLLFGLIVLLIGAGAYFLWAVLERIEV